MFATPTLLRVVLLGTPKAERVEDRVHLGG